MACIRVSSNNSEDNYSCNKKYCWCCKEKENLIYKTDFIKNKNKTFDSLQQVKREKCKMRNK